MLNFGTRLAFVGSGPGTDTAGPPIASPQKEPLKILIVNDNRDAADALGAHLQTAGHQVLITYSGKEAWRACKEFAPSALIVDIGLPRLNGFQLARRIRRTAWGMRVRLIAVTGWKKSGDTELAKFVGFDHFCEKPGDFTEIERLIQ